MARNDAGRGTLVFRAALMPHPRGDVGIAPYAEGARFFVGADAHIGPWANGTAMSVLPDRSGDAPHGAMRASPPTLKTHVVFVGADGMGVSVFSDRSGDIPHGAMKASPPTGMTFPQKGKSKPAHIFSPPE